MTQPGPSLSSEELRSTARLVLFTFLLTFIAARVLVYCIMARDIPDLFVHVGGTHIHHLNYGIFLLSGVGAYLLFVLPTGVCHTIAAVVYGVGLALTFDEFGMWLHLGGSYWQRASYDAVVVLASGLALLAYAPRLTAFRERRMLGAVAASLCILVFFGFWSRAWKYAGPALTPKLEQLEERGPK